MEISSFTMTMRDYLRVIFRQKAVIVTCVMAVMAAVIIGLQMKTPVYEAKVRMLVSALKQVESPYYKEMMTGYRGSQIVLTQSEIVKSSPVMELAVSAMALDKKPLDYEAGFASSLKKKVIRFFIQREKEELSRFSDQQLKALMFQNAVENLKNAIEVQPIRDTDMFMISARDYSPLGSAVMANVVSRAYIIFDLQQQLAELQLKYGEKHSIVMQMQDNIKKMIRALNGEPMSGADAMGPASVKIIEQASIPREPIGLSDTVMIILSFIASVFLGVMFAFVSEYLDQTFKSPADIERYLNVPFLGFIPRKRAKEAPVIRPSDVLTPYGRALHTICEKISFVIKHKNLRMIMMTSAKVDEGVTTTIANLGSCLANTTGHRVLLVDANMRNPRLHHLFNIKNDRGLANILENKDTLDNCVKPVSEYLSVLPSGASEFDPALLFNTYRMHEVFKSLKDKYGIVLIDAPALKDYQDAKLIALHVDAACAVIKEGETRRQVLEASLSPLVERKINIIGAILNNRTFVIPQVIYERV